MLVIINIESILVHRQASHTGYTMIIIHTPVYGAVEACRTHWHRLHTLHCSVGCEILASSHAWWGLRAHTACKICAAHRPHHIDPTPCYSLRTHAGGKPGKAKPKHMINGASRLERPLAASKSSLVILGAFSFAMAADVPTCRFSKCLCFLGLRCTVLWRVLCCCSKHAWAWDRLSQRVAASWLDGPAQWPTLHPWHRPPRPQRVHTQVTPTQPMAQPRAPNPKNKCECVRATRTGLPRYPVRVRGGHCRAHTWPQWTSRAAPYPRALECFPLRVAMPVTPAVFGATPGVRGVDTRCCALGQLRYSTATGVFVDGPLRVRSGG